MRIPNWVLPKGGIRRICAVLRHFGLKTGPKGISVIAYNPNYTDSRPLELEQKMQKLHGKKAIVELQVA